MPHGAPVPAKTLHRGLQRSALRTYNKVKPSILLDFKIRIIDSLEWKEEKTQGVLDNFRERREFRVKLSFKTIKACKKL